MFGGPSLQAVYILSAVRTPIGKFGGSLASMTAADMGVVAAEAAMERARVQPQQIEETIFGNARQAGEDPIPLARSRSAVASRRRFPLTRSTRPAPQDSSLLHSDIRKLPPAISIACWLAVPSPCPACRTTSTAPAGVIAWGIRNSWMACTATGSSV